MLSIHSSFTIVWDSGSRTEAKQLMNKLLFRLEIFIGKSKLFLTVISESFHWVLKKNIKI
jgi:hypothetical protein